MRCKCHTSSTIAEGEAPVGEMQQRKINFLYSSMARLVKLFAQLFSFASFLEKGKADVGSSS